MVAKANTDAPEDAADEQQRDGVLGRALEDSADDEGSACESRVSEEARSASRQASNAFRVQHLLSSWTCKAHRQFVSVHPERDKNQEDCKKCSWALAHLVLPKCWVK